MAKQKTNTTPTTKAVTLEWVSFWDLIFLENNPRTRTEEGKRKMAADIEADPSFYENRPTLVNLVDGQYQVYAGDLRAHAAHDVLGWPMIPCNVEADVPPELMRSRAILDNTHRETWDAEKLGEWGYDPEELEEMGVWLADEAEEGEGGVPNNALNSEKVEEDDFEPPEIEEIKTDIVLGDLFEIGPHRLLCGDSTRAEDVARVMGGAKADMVLTDPPYGMSLDADYSGMTNRQGVSGRKHSDIIGDESGFDARIVLDAHPLAKEVFLFGADYFAETIKDRNKGAFLVWDKRGSEQLDAVFGSSFETIWSKRRRKRSILRHEYATWGARMADSLDGSKPHPTMKPVKLIAAIIALCDEGLVSIVDPFLGSGTTMVAAHQLGRVCYGMELEPKYCDVIVRRMLKLDNTLTVKRNGVDETAKWLIV